MLKRKNLQSKRYMLHFFFIYIKNTLWMLGRNAITPSDVAVVSIASESSAPQINCLAVLNDSDYLLFIHSWPEKMFHDFP